MGGIEQGGPEVPEKGLGEKETGGRCCKMIVDGAIIELGRKAK